MLKIRDDVNLEELEKYGFEKNIFGRPYVYRHYVIKLWVDDYRILHYNGPAIKEIDIIYKMHDLLELTDFKPRELQNLQRKQLLDRLEKANEYIKNNNVDEELKKIIRGE